MRRIWFSWLAAAVIVVLLASWPEARQLTLSAELDQFLEAQRVASKAPALQVAVSFKGTQIYSKAFGTADLEFRAPASVTTAFRTASVAKPIDRKSVV